MNTLSKIKIYIYRIRKNRDLKFRNFQKSLHNLFLNFNISNDNNLILIGKKNYELISEYKTQLGEKPVFYFEINQKGNKFIDISDNLNADNINFDISVLTETEFNKYEYQSVEKNILDSKVVVFSFDNYFKESFNDFAELNHYFKSNGFQLFSISNKRIYSLNDNKDEYNNYDSLSLFAIKKINLLKIIDGESKISFSFRDN